jgi:hypothetical protein
MTVLHLISYQAIFSENDQLVIFFHMLLLPCCYECVYLITHFLHLIELLLLRHNINQLIEAKTEQIVPQKISHDKM